MSCQATDGLPPPACAPRTRPRSFASWLPILWSETLFPGEPVPYGRPRLLSLLILLVVPALLLYPCLGFPLFEPDESRYAEIPREMLQRRELVVPYLQSEPYLHKPPLLYWLIEASYRQFGVRIWAARLVPALAVHLTILLAYLFGRRAVGERGAFWGALMLGLAPGFLSMGRLLLIDGLLTLCTTLALFSGFEAVRGPRLRWGWWLLSATAAGLGVLTKGPVAVVLLLPPLWLQRRLTSRGCVVGRPGWVAFAVVVTAVALPWYVALCGRIPSFAASFLWHHNIMRFLSPAEHVRGVWFYGPVLLLALLPGTLLAIPFFRFLLSGKDELVRQRPPELGFLILAGGWCVLFFTLSACKLPTYIMPAFPPLALAGGYFLTRSDWSRSRAPAVAALTTFLLLAGTNHVALPWYAGYRSPMRRPDAVRRLCADRSTPVVCYPRNCDSVAFHLRRDDLRSYRSKDIEALRRLVRERPRTIVLCTHRHSLHGLKQLLPPEVRVVHEVRLGLEDIPGMPRWAMPPLVHLMGETALGLCDVAVVERVFVPPPPPPHFIPPPLPPGGMRPPIVNIGNARPN